MVCHNRNEFEGNIPENLQCPINQGVLKDPVRDECGHAFCKDCFATFYNSEKICPVTKQRISAHTSPAPDLAQEVTNLTIRCKHSGSGCTWMGPLNAAAAHLGTDCPQESTECGIDKCQQKVRRFELATHREKCEWRSKKCQFCTFEANDIIMEEHHNSDCQEIPIDCEKRCIVKHKRKLKDIHDKFNCEKAKYDCYFRNAGCYFTGTWDEMGRHSTEGFVIHATLLEQKLQHFEAYRAVAAKLVNEINANKDKYTTLVPFVKELDDTEDMDFKAFQGAFDKAYSSPSLEIDPKEDNRVATSRLGGQHQLLWLDRKFHEHHRIIIHVEKYRPAEGHSAFAIGLAKKGVLLEAGTKQFTEADRKKYRLFSDNQPNGCLSDLKMPIKEGGDYMMSYNVEKPGIVLEMMSIDDENTPQLFLEFSTEFWEFQPVLILSGDIVVRLADFNDWNQ